MILALLLVGTVASTQELLSFLEPATLERLERQGELRNSLADGLAPQLVPAIPERQELVQTVRSTSLTTGVELLRLHEGRTDYSTPEAHLRIYNLLRSISTMKGLEYYSASRKKMRTLFAESYLVDGPNSGLPQPDPVVTSIPAYSTACVFQEDLTFGKNYYSAAYRYGGNYFLVDNRNLTTMRYLLVPMVRPGDSLSILVLIPAGRRILFYGLSGAHTARFFGLERAKEDSSYHRLQALYGWFTQRLEALEAEPSP